MKKSIKILALILTLALVCGAFVIGAFAADDEKVHVGYDYSERVAVTGENLITYMDFEELAVKGYGPANQQGGQDIEFKSNNGVAAGLYYMGRQGEASIVSAIKGAENKYLQIDMNADSLAAANKGPYATYHLQSAAGTAKEAEGRWGVMDSQYIVLDADVYFPSATLSNSPNFNIQFRVYNKDGNRVFPNDVSLDGNSVNWQFATSGNDYTVNGNVINKNGWSHLTGIVEMNVLTDDSGVAYTQLKVYTIVDGVLGSNVKVIDNKSANAASYYNGDKTFVIPYEARMQFGHATDGTQFLSDNVAVRRLDSTYAGDLASYLAKGAGTNMTECDINVYDLYNMPYGNTIATRVVDGEIVEYDNLQKAINEAEEEETITLLANSTKPVTVEKALYIDGTDAGYTCDFTVVEGYAVVKNGNIYVVEPATEGLTVYWYPCDCGNDCYEEAEIVVYEGNSIYEAYKAAMGYYPTCETTEDPATHTKQTLVGFADATGIIENFTTETVVTADMVGETIELEPVYVIDYPIFVNVTKDAYYYAPKTLNDVVGSASAGDTIKLLANAETTAQIGVYMTLTIDLNGYRLTTLTYRTNGTDGRQSTFSISGNSDLTVTSTRPGATIYNASINTDSNGVVGNALVNGGSGGIIRFKGDDDEGNTTLKAYCSCFIQSYASYIKTYIDGGEYYRTGSDQWAFLDFRATGEGEIKDAYIVGGSRVFLFSGSTVNGSNSSNPVYTIDNCIIDGDVISDYTFAGLEVTFTNCYLGGKIDPVGKFNDSVVAPADPASTHIIGDGCFIEAGVSVSNVKYPDGSVVYDTTIIKEIVDTRNNFKSGDPLKLEEDDLALKTTTLNLTYDKMVAPEGLTEITVNWVDTEGNTIGTTQALPGTNAAAPLVPVAGTNGMVNASYSDWVGGTLIPVNAKDGYAITLAEGAGVTYTAGIVDIKFNFDMINHIQYNYYIPEAPEGIEYVEVNFNGNKYAYGNWNFSTNYKYIDSTGVKHTVGNCWPSAQNTDVDYSMSVSYKWNGMDFTYTAPSINLAKYVDYILEAEKYSEYEEIKTVMADLIRMIEQANVAAGQTTSTEFKAVYAKAEKYFTVADKVIDPADTNDLTSVDAYLDDVDLVFVSGLGAMTVGVKAKDGYVALMAGKSTVHGAAAIGDNRKIDSTGYIYAHNVRTYAMSEIIVISFYNTADTTQDGQVVKANAGATPVATVEFTISGYVNDNADTFSDSTKALVEAVFGYAYSAGEYMDWRAKNLHKA